jgi:hypothetical protein
MRCVEAASASTVASSVARHSFFVRRQMPASCRTPEPRAGSWPRLGRVLRIQDVELTAPRRMRLARGWASEERALRRPSLAFGLTSCSIKRKQQPLPAGVGVDALAARLRIDAPDTSLFCELRSQSFDGTWGRRTLQRANSWTSGTATLVSSSFSWGNSSSRRESRGFFLSAHRGSIERTPSLRSVSCRSPYPCPDGCHRSLRSFVASPSGCSDQTCLRQVRALAARRVRGLVAVHRRAPYSLSSSLFPWTLQPCGAATCCACKGVFITLPRYECFPLARRAARLRPFHGR